MRSGKVRGGKRKGGRKTFDIDLRMLLHGTFNQLY